LQQRRRISFIKLGCSIRFTRQDLTSYLQRNRVEAVGT
jgi:hypothetical protein